MITKEKYMTHIFWTNDHCVTNWTQLIIPVGFKTIRANAHFEDFENWVTVLYFNPERSSGTVTQANNIHCKKYRNFTWFTGVEILCLSAKFPHQEIRWNYRIFRSDKVTFHYYLTGIFLFRDNNQKHQNNAQKSVQS